jgi:hypothetical protein
MEMPETDKTRPVRRWFWRWLLKLALWFVTLTAVVLGIVAVVGLIAYWNLSGIANFALSKFADPYRIELGRVDVSERGVVRLGDVRIRPPLDFGTATDIPWVTLAGVDLSYDWAELRREHRLRSIVLRQPAIHLDDVSLKVLGLDGETTKASAPDEVAPPFDLRSLGRITDRIEIVSGSLVVNTSRAPRFEAGWDASIPAIDFSHPDWLNVDPLTLRFSDLKIGKEGGGGSVDRIALAGRIRSDLRGIEIARLGLENPKLKLTPDLFSAAKAGARKEKASAPATDTDKESKAAFQILLGVLDVRGAALEVSGFESTPPVSLTTELVWKDLTIDGSRIRSAAPLTWSVENLKVGDLATVEKVTSVFVPTTLVERGRVESIEIEGPRLLLTPKTVPERATPAADAAKTATAPLPEGEKRQPAWEIGALSVRRGALEARDWQFNGLEIPIVKVADISADGKALSAASFSAEGGPAVEDAVQSIELRGVSAGEAEKGPMEVESIAAKFRVGSVLREKRLDALVISKPVLRLTDEALPGWFEKEVAAPESVGEEKAAAILTVDDLSMVDGDLRVDTRGMDGRIPKLEGAFSIAKAPGNQGKGEDLLYCLKLERLNVGQREEKPAAASAEPAKPVEKLGGLFPGDDTDPKPTNARAIGIREQDVALLRELNIDFTPAGIQRDRRIERIEVKGAELQVGDALRGLVDGKSTATPKANEKDAPLQQSPQPQAATGDKKAWRIGELAVTETHVRFQALIPQIEGLEFAIETKLQDVPLSQGGLLAQDSRQKVEIAGIEIRDPYDGFITVATLPTIFVEFSLAGLLSQRIDKIDLINPAIHVGQGLFWWVEYQRKYRQTNEGTAFTGAGAAPVAPNDEGQAATNWEIREINAHLGKIVIAPVGRPIGIVPFPFNASTNLINGEIALKLQIPKEQQFVYRFPDLKLDLFGLAGNVEFNVPIKQESNNLVQTFTLDRAVWKQHEATGLFLTVTYDQDGVYGRFGGASYGGYAEGQFNAYFSDVGKWDAWIAGTKMDMGPITKVLAPENFIMDGKIDLKLISQGKGLVFGETSGELRTLSPGRIDVTKVNELIEELPDSWSEMKRSATQLGLDTFKAFEYETGRGDLYFLNRDGWLKLDLRGPTGSRVLEAYAHDWRREGAPPPSIEEKLADFKVSKDAEEPEPELTTPEAASGISTPVPEKTGRKSPLPQSPAFGRR